jgi:hypothetical protein
MMLGRIVLFGALLVASGSSAAFAGSPASYWMLKKACSNANQSQCAIQIVNGNGNWATTEQSTNRKRSHQMALTFQKGDGNISYTGQVNGKHQTSLTTQVGNNNASYTYQEGKYNFSKTTQVGDGTWAVSSGIGEGTYVNISVSN